ncbi:unnamed protein product [Closterium sp. NIES-54]
MMEGAQILGFFDGSLPYPTNGTQYDKQQYTYQSMMATNKSISNNSTLVSSKDNIDSSRDNIDSSKDNIDSSKDNIDSSRNNIGSSRNNGRSSRTIDTNCCSLTQHHEKYIEAQTSPQASTPTPTCTVVHQDIELAKTSGTHEWDI